MSLPKCDLCGKKKEMYYRPWCPRCEKPKEESVVVMNLIQVLRYLVVNKIISEKDRKDLWKELCDYFDLRNDSIISINFKEIASDKFFNKDIRRTVNSIVDVFGDREYLWEVSW